MTDWLTEVLRASGGLTMSTAPRSRLARAGRPGGKAGPPAPAPLNVILQYQTALEGMVDRWLAHAVEQIVEEWHLNGTARPWQPAERIDGSGWIFQKVRFLAAEIDASSELISPQVTLAAQGVEQSVVGALRYLQRVNLSQLVPGSRTAEFRRRNVGLIKSLGDGAKERLTGTLEQAEREGWRPETLKAQIFKDFDVTKSKADLLARDQILKLNAEITQERQRQAGISQYQWSTSGDDRVREMHADLDGSIQSWDDPPETNEDGDRNHPGEDYQCRCVAIPILPDLP